MRRFIAAASAAGIGFAFTATYAVAASASVIQASVIRASVIVVSPGHSIQAAVDHAHPGDTILLKAGVFHQSVQIRTDRITLRGSGDSRSGTVLEPPARLPRTICNRVFGGSGVCVLAKKLNLKNGAVRQRVYGDTVTDLRVANFPASGVFGYGTYGLTVTNVAAVRDGAYGISRFESTRTLFADDIAVGNHEAGFYVGDSPDAAAVVRDNRASGNQLGVFIRHARGVRVIGNRVTKNCQGILVLDDGQRGGVGNAVIKRNGVFGNSKFCPKTAESPRLKGGGILLLGATETRVADNSVAGNTGRELNSGGIVILSARQLTHGSNPRHDSIVNNTAYRNRPADIRWDGTGSGLHFARNHCRTSAPAGLCH
jgi:parallel beta helix pectate lyase-like protein